jgi:iron-sulfur cluster insertion protein
MDDTSLKPGARTVTLSESAARRIAALAAAEGNPALKLRLTVSGGGCSGFQYQYGFDTAAKDDDHLFERDGIGLLVDDVSLDLVAGSELNFVEDLMGSYFEMRNPNATSSCGCGTSFSIG